MLFRYLAARWRYREPQSQRFIRAGLGLERRGFELAAHWADHLSRTRAAQSRWAQSCGDGGLLTVLGPGPLRDFNSSALGRKFQRFRFVDANPLAPAEWSRLSLPVDPVVTDISNCLAPWSSSLSAFKGTWLQTLEFLSRFGNNPVPAYFQPADAVLSLNILSQLEIGWQDAVETVLQKRFGRFFVRKREQEWLDAIRPGSRSLLEQHLYAFEQSAASSVLLITDVEYVDYTGRKYSRKFAAPPPFTWSESGGWQSEPGIYSEITPALEGLALNAETFHRWTPSYRLAWLDTWLWHIAPLGTEASRKGRLHRVAAFALERATP